MTEKSRFSPAAFQAELRRLLRNEFPDGASASDLAELVDRDRHNVKQALALMPDVFVDRWEPTSVVGHYRAIYMAVEVPQDCPKPELEAA